MTTLDSQDWRELERLFEKTEALEEDELSEFLTAIAAERPDLAAELARLVAADRADNPIGERLKRFAEAIIPRGLEPGQRVDCWAIRRLLGRGGMGAVYLAERDDRVYRQSVVVKVLDAPMAEGLDERFGRERQILADLDHPNIARLIDGGSLADGRPYLVMDYVDGCSITRYCEEQELGLRQRVALMGQVIEAVQFAHANLVIHRDIKPDNVMVDQSGRVRLLDFGIAKLVAAEAEESDSANASSPAATAAFANPNQTLHGGGALSPAYASPEQMHGEAITIATDIYSLGALLYRLLTGLSPHDRAAQRDGQWRLPSDLLAEQNRPRDARSARGDLDAIIGKAMAAAANERYASAAALSDDLERWLSHHPVRARRTGWADHLVKFTRRNRALAASLTISVVIMLGLLAGLSVLAVKLDRERTVALQAADTTEQIADYLVELFSSADPTTHQGEMLTARELLDRGVERIRDQADTAPVVRARLLHRMALAYRNLGLLDDAMPLYESAIAAGEQGPAEETWAVRLELADLYRARGEHDEAFKRLDAAIQALETQGGPPEALASAYNNYSILLEQSERYDEAESWARRALDIAATLPDTRHNAIQISRFRHNLALALGGQGQYDPAIEILEQVIEAKTRQLGPRHPSRLVSMDSLATMLRTAGRLGAAAELAEASLALRREIYDPDALDLARTGNEVANVYHDAGRYRDAERVYREALRIIEIDPARDPLLHAIVVNNLASLYEDSGDLERAEPLFRQSIDLRRSLPGGDTMAVIRAQINLGRLLIKLGEAAEAGSVLDAAQATLSEQFPENQYRWQAAEIQQALLDASVGREQAARARLGQSLAALESMGAMAAGSLRSAQLAAARIEIDAGGDVQGALDRILAIEAQLPAVLAPDHPQRQVLIILRAQALFGLGRREEARRLAAAAAPQLALHFAEGAEIRRRAESLLAES